MKLTLTEPEEFDAMVDHTANLIVEHEAMKAKLEAKLAKVREDFGYDLAGNETSIQNRLETLEAYATENKEALFGDKSKRETTTAVATLRKKAAALKKEEGVDDADVIAALEERGWFDLLSKKTTLDKTAIKKRIQNGSGDAEFLTDLGLILVEDEAFKVALK